MLNKARRELTSNLTPGQRLAQFVLFCGLAGVAIALFTKAFFANR